MTFKSFKLLNFSFVAASVEDIEEFFSDPSKQNIRRFFSPSFAFNIIDVNSQKR